MSAYGFVTARNDMRLGRVIGKVICTVKTPSLIGKKLLLVQPVDSKGCDRGNPLVALDSVGAGTGEIIYWCRGREASFAFSPAEIPTEATIVGIVDRIHVPEFPHA